MIPANQSNVIEFAAECNFKDGKLISPVLYSMNKNGKYLRWVIQVGLIDIDTNKLVPIIKSQYTDRAQIDDTLAGAYWTISGQEDGKRMVSEKTLIYEGKYAGKSNFTTPLTQAILDARSEFHHKIRKGYYRDKAALKKPGEAISLEELIARTDRGEYPWRVFAMALHDYKKFSRKIKFPATIQYKLDGTLYIIVAHPALPLMRIVTPDGPSPQREFHMDAYSRGRETYEGHEHILLDIADIAIANPGLHFIGELWKEGFGLQEISGASRRKADSKIKSERIPLNFNIFDCFYLDKPMGFAERQSMLDTILAQFSGKYITRIPIEIVKNDAEVQAKLETYLAAGHEGAVIRNMDAPYEFGLNKEIRSYFSLKLKPRDDAEWPIIDFKQGDKGKEVGAIIWVCAENNEGVQARAGELLPLESRLQFNVTPNQDYDARRYIYSKLSADRNIFDTKIRGQFVTISYSILSYDNLPQQPKMLHFRDTSIDEFLLA